MSLREEIQEILDRFKHEDTYVQYTATMDILEKVEKRLDEIAIFKEDYPGEFKRGYGNAMDRVKELLK